MSTIWDLSPARLRHEYDVAVQIWQAAFEAAGGVVSAE